MKTANRESGVVLVAVVCLAAVAAVLAVGLLSESGSQLKLAGRQTTMEQAFYIAEGGAERAVAYIQRAGTNIIVGNTITGLMGNGRFDASIFGSTETPDTGDTHTVAGRININPNNSPENEFLMLTTDGASYNRDNLQDQDLADYNGAASLVHVKPKGNSDQTTLDVDGASYTLDKNYAYTFSAVSMNVVLTNDNRNPQGKAVGKWWIYINGNNVDLSDDSGGSSQAAQYYTIYSIGTVGTSRRLVIMEGVHQMSWAKYAMWYNDGPGAIWIRSGERFDGPVHANTYIYLQGDPVFNALVSSTRSSWGSGSATNNVDFNAGYLLSAPAQSMASINFPNLLAQSSMVITGMSSITMSGTNLRITSWTRGWTNQEVAVPSNGMIYVQQAASGGSSSTRKGTVSVGGVLDGRLSIVAENNIQITNHITYANTNIVLTATNITDDALGLIAKQDVIVMDEAPDNLNIYAHIIAEGSATSSSSDGSFYVEHYDSRDYSDLLNVYGGIVQYYRGAVGTFGGWGGDTGFSKNYIFDQRFTANPPPYYPTVTNDYQWQGWRDKPL